MSEIVGATSSSVAPASSLNLALVKIADPPVVDAAAALAEVIVQKPDLFWTICDKCELRLEYPIQYQGFPIVCPLCHEPFIAKDVPLDSNVGRTAKRVRRAPKKDTNVIYKDKLAAKHVEAAPPTGNVSMPVNFQPEKYHGQPIGDGSGFTIQPRHRSSELMEPLAAEDKVSEQEHTEEMSELQETHKETPPEDVFAELKKIPNLAREDLLKAYNILRRDNFQFRSLIALPMEFRKEWLLMEIASK